MLGCSALHVSFSPPGTLFPLVALTPQWAHPTWLGTLLPPSGGAENIVSPPQEPPEPVCSHFGMVRRRPCMSATTLAVVTHRCRAEQPALESLPLLEVTYYSMYFF